MFNKKLKKQIASLEANVYAATRKLEDAIENHEKEMKFAKADFEKIVDHNRSLAEE